MTVRITIVLLLFAASQASATTLAMLPHADGDIRIDGTLDDDAWFSALRIELDYENDPGENTAAPVRTVAWLIEDGNSLYVAFEAYDPEPKRIRAWLRDRDSLGSNDYVGISLDTYDDGRRAFEFMVNPLGVQLDRLFDDVTNNNDAAWDATWDSAGRIREGGYVVEMRIPLSQLRFQDTEQAQIWRYRVVRSWPRDRQVLMSNMRKDRNRNCSICQYPQLMGFAGSKAGENLEIVPTLTASHFQATSAGGSSVERTDTNAGLSARYRITPELSANLAINPDFSHVEADSTQLDVNNRFTLSLPERRPFFLEGADHFRTPHEAVFTRTVSSPEVAFKLSGKRGDNAIGGFVARDQVTSLLFPGPTGSATTVLNRPNTVFVGRYNRSFSGALSVGGLLTVRDGSHYRNTVGGFDGLWRINDQHELSGQVLESSTTYPDAVSTEFGQPHGEFGGRAVVVQHSYESRTWFAKLNHWRVDGSFRADAGFMTQAGSAFRKTEIGRKWYGGESSWWARVRFRGYHEVKDRADGLLLEETQVVGFDVSGPFQSEVDVRLRSSREFDSGRYFDVERVDVSTQLEPLGGLQVGFDMRLGDQVDYDNLRVGEQFLFEPFITWNVNRNLFLRIDGSKVALETPAGQPVLDATALDARLMWHFNRKSYLRLSVQQREIERHPEAYVAAVDASLKDVGHQLLYSWKLNPQTVLFLGYSDAYERARERTEARVSERRWFLKVGYGFAI